jgi:hypothetical protein
MRRCRALVRFLATALVVAAGSAMVANAAGLTVSSAKLGTVAATVPTCPSGSMKVKAAHAGTPADITTVTATLNTCTGAGSGDTLYVTIQNTTTGSRVGDASCTLSATGCTTPTLSGGPVTYVARDDYSLDFTTSPGAAGTTVTSHGLSLNSQYLTLRTCSGTAVTGTKLNAGTVTC